MNLLETIDDELRYRHLNDFEKARYIYLRCCELFSFDIRWNYSFITHDYKLNEALKNKRFDIENIDTDLVICYSFTPDILKRLINEFTTLDCSVKNELGHVFLNMDYNGHTWKLDATDNSDLARVKLNLQTTDFKSAIPDYELILDEIDLNLGYSNLDIDYYKRQVSGNSFTDCIENAGYILRDSKAKYHFADAILVYSLLMSKYCEGHNTYFDKDYNSHKLMKVTGEYSFFDLCKDDGEYKLKRIEANDYKKLTKTLYRL
jgi:hypothetical protein